MIQVSFTSGEGELNEYGKEVVTGVVMLQESLTSGECAHENGKVDIWGREVTSFIGKFRVRAYVYMVKKYLLV